MNEYVVGRIRRSTAKMAIAPLKIVLVDGHALFRIGARQFLTTVAGCEVVGEAGSARDAFKLIDAVAPDLVLMGINLPGMDGIVATREIRRRAPQVRVLILSAFDHVSDVSDAMVAGASGYVVKSDGPEILLQALEQVARGEHFLSPVLEVRLPTGAGMAPDSVDPLGVLSEREREIFRLAADCRPTSDIARDLCVALKTVGTHLNRIQRKLRLRNRAELVRLAFKLGLVHAIRPPRPAR
jgi:DNA-binding NarL/FixJ family response regulator